MPDPGRSLYEALRVLEHRAVTARRRAGLPGSRRAAAAAARKSPYDTEVDSRRISSWLPEDAGLAQVPRIGDAEIKTIINRHQPAQVLADLAGNPGPAQSRALLALALTVAPWEELMTFLIHIDPVKISSIAHEYLTVTFLHYSLSQGPRQAAIDSLISVACKLST